MKNIILATDFSLNAHIAAIFAGEVARCIGARLIVFFALSPLMKFKQKDTLLLNPEGLMQKKLDDLAHELRSRFGVSVTRLLKPGFPEDEIPALVKRLDAKAVILGAQGERDNKNHFGELAKTLRSQNSFPAVCVPAVEPSDFSHILAVVEQNKDRYCNEAGCKFFEMLMMQNASGELVSQRTND